MFKGDAGLVRGLDLTGTPFVKGFVVSTSFAIDPEGLLGDVDREDDWDLDFDGGSREDRGNE